MWTEKLRGNIFAANEYRCCRGMTPQPLTDAEFDSLSGVLTRFGGKDAMNVEQLDGFLAAVICFPRRIPEIEYLPAIWGDETINDKAFVAQPVLHTTSVNAITYPTRGPVTIESRLLSAGIYTQYRHVSNSAMNVR